MIHLRHNLHRKKFSTMQLFDNFSCRTKVTADFWDFLIHSCCLLIVGIWCSPLSKHLLPPARPHPHPLIQSTQRINQKETNISEKRSNIQQILLYCLSLCTQKPGLTYIIIKLLGRVYHFSLLICYPCSFR